MSSKSRGHSPFKLVGKHLQLQARILEEAGASRDLIAAYHDLSHFLARTPDTKIQDTISERKRERPSGALALPDLDSMGLSDLEDRVRAKETPRKVLEYIAQKRFHVPAGSMRSYSNIEVLKQKLLTLVENERTHVVISNAAQRHKP